jgi:hypothetical protein
MTRRERTDQRDEPVDDLDLDGNLGARDDDDLVGAAVPPRRQGTASTAPRPPSPLGEPSAAHIRDPRRPPTSLSALLHHDVEIRTLSGGCYRGELIGVTKEFALLERHSGRLALVRIAAVAACCDEAFEVLR